MAKASLTLPNGTVVQIKGTADEVRDLLQFYGARTGHGAPPAPKPGGPLKVRKTKSGRSSSRNTAGEASESAPNLSEIVNVAKDCDEAEGIERQILDRASQVDRTLLPLYIVHEYLGNAMGLSSGEISKITANLSVPVSQSNASTTLSGTAAKYVIGDKVRKKGQAVRYKLSRRGFKYMKTVIGGKGDENAG